MNCEEERKIEREVLYSIFSCDQRFNVIGESKFQYKFGEDGDNRSLVLEVSWPDTYPETVPEISLDLFYNAHIQPKVKTDIKERLLAEAEKYTGMAVTFILIDYVRENFENLLKCQVELCGSADEKIEKDDSEAYNEEEAVEVRKMQMTKAQKRRMWDHTNASKFGEKERGWNWVDIIKHLSRTRDSV